MKTVVAAIVSLPLTIIMTMILVFGFVADTYGQKCYRPFAGYGGVNYGQSYSYSPPTYYKEYVPYVLEVQVNRDRYYSLSDLYRDRLYLEAFDMMRDIRTKLDQDRNSTSPPASGYAPSPPAQTPRVQSTTANIPNSPVAIGRAGQKAVAALNAHCLSCHGKDNKHLDLTNVDTVPLTKRWAAFGLVASGDMPPVPSDVLVKGRDEINKWKKENALKEEELQAIYNEWVMPAKLAKK